MTPARMAYSRTVFFEDDRLPDLVLRGCVVFDPLAVCSSVSRPTHWGGGLVYSRSPLRGLAPPIRVQVERAIIDRVNPQLLVEVTAVARGIRPIGIPGKVELALSPGSH